MQRTRTSAVAVDVSLVTPLLEATVLVMRPASSETSTNRSFLFAVLSVLLRTVSHAAPVVAFTSWVWEIVAVALAEGVPLCGGSGDARSGLLPIMSVATATRQTEASPTVRAFLVGVMVDLGIFGMK